MQSVSSEEAVPVFELSDGSTISSDNGVYPLRASEGDEHIPDDDSLEGSVSAADEPVFVEPQVIQLASWFGFLNFKSRLLTLQIVLTKCRRIFFAYGMPKSKAVKFQVIALVSLGDRKSVV